MNTSAATAGHSPGGSRAEARDRQHNSEGHAVTRLVGDDADATGAGRNPGVETGASPGAVGVRATRSRTSRSRLVSWLVVWDALVSVGLLILAGRFEGAFGPPLNGGGASHSDPLILLLAVICPTGLAMVGAYHQRRRRGGSRLRFALKLGVVAITVSWIALIASAAAGWPIDFAQMFVLSLLLPVGWMIGRWACDRHPSAGPERVLLVGSGVVAQHVLDLAVRHRERRLDIVGRVEADHGRTDVTGPPLLGELADLHAILGAHGVDRVIVAFAPGRDRDLLDVLRECVAAGVEVDVVPRFFDLVGPAPHLHSIGGLALMEVPGRGLTPAQRAVKRTLDIIGSLALILLFSPFIAAAAVAIAAFDGRPILFRQTRVGQMGRTFSILKFRTMSVGSDSEGVALRAASADAAARPLDAGESISELVHELKATSDARVTRLGAILRKTSLDELPQLFNILRGDMSLVGPRPLRPFEAAALNPWQLARQDLRPGLTGLWQVLGRSNVDWGERMQLDYSYVSHWSFASDIQILARTLPAVLKKEGAV